MQAVIITAYNQPKQVAELCKKLSGKFEVFLHFDKKTKLTKSEIEMFDMEHVHFYQLYKVNWGGYKHLLAILHMIKKAYEYEDISYFHIISGNDWPIKPIEEIYNFFEDNNSCHMSCTRLTNLKGKFKNTVHSWQRYYSFLDIFNYKNILQTIFVKLFVLFQGFFGVDRINKLYKDVNIELSRGLVWGDFPRGAVKYCFDYIDSNPEFMCFLMYGHASEEFFFQSILNSSSVWSKKIVTDNLRYIDWNGKRNGSYPAILDESDCDDILGSNAMFARKLSGPCSDKLREKIDHFVYSRKE